MVMKRLLILGLPLIVAALSSCSIKEEIVPVEQTAPLKFRAGMEQPVADASTKAYATTEYKLYWNEGDRLSIFYGTTYNREYEFAGLDGAAAGEFERVGEDGEYITDPPITTGYNYAILPYHKKYNLCDTDGTLTTFILAEQEFYNDRLGIGARPLMVARDKGGVLMFKHVGCYVGVRLRGEGVKVASVTIKGNNSELLAGRLLITFDDAGLPITEFDERFLANDSETVTMTLATPVELNTDDYKVFWFNLPEVTFDQGLTITVTDVDGGTCDIIKSNKLTFKRTVFYTTTADVEITPATVPVSSVSVAPTSLNLKPGDTETLVATVLPADASNKNVTWTSSDANVASVDANGKVTAHAAGEAVITATTVDGEKTANCAVTVNDVISYSLAITPATATINYNETQTYEVTLTTVKNGQSTTSTVNATLSSDDTSVATVSGLVATGKKGGTAKISASYEVDGTTVTTATPATLTVIDAINYSLAITPATATINYNETQTYEVTLTTVKNGQSTTSTVNATLSSDDTNVATVSGLVATGKKGGTAKISASYQIDGTTVTTATPATLTVKDVVSYSLAITPATATINYNETQTYEVTLTTVKNGVSTSSTVNATLSSDDTNVATVSGLVATGKKGGTAKISASYEVDGTTVTTATPATLTVKDVITYSLAISPAENAKVIIGKTQAFTLTLTTTTNGTPVESTVTTENWTSSDDKVATVANGIATGVAEGEVTITTKYTTPDNVEHTLTAPLTVTKDPNTSGDPIVIGGEEEL